MGGISLTLRPSEAERFDDAFYRFLDLGCASGPHLRDRCCTLQTIPEGANVQKLVRLWSDEADEEFILFWRARHADHAEAPPSPA